MRFYVIAAVMVVGVGSILYSMLSSSQSQSSGSKVVKSIDDHGWVTEKKQEAERIAKTASFVMSEQVIDAKRTERISQSKIHKTDREAVRQRSEEMMEARRAYLVERHKWRRALNEAHQKAKKTGNYDEYNMLKEMEPDKASFLN